MTEASPVCKHAEVDDPLEVRVGTVGKVFMPHQRSKKSSIQRPAKSWPAASRVSCVTAATKSCAATNNNPEGTRQAIDAAGWLHSGDLAVMDEQGYVKITGRLKDMICRGGEKVFPREVEEFLYAHPDIVDVQVIGVPDLEVRRGDHGVGKASFWSRPVRRGRSPAVLPRPDCPLQDPSLRSGG